MSGPLARAALNLALITGAARVLTYPPVLTKWAKSKTELKEGAMALSVNGERCHGADDARRMLRDTCADKSAKLVLQVWRPPEDFVHGEGGGGGTGTGKERETEGGGRGCRR